MTRLPFDAGRIPEPAGEAPSRRSLTTVSQVTAMINKVLEAGLPATLHIVGEISNFKRHSSGHLYFTLKDPGSELPCVMWRSAAKDLKFRPEDGQEVVATGGIEVFEKAGRYQLYVRRVEPVGVGALELAFRQLFDRLQREGLFEPARKKPIPRFPFCVAVVTSPTGAAVHDIVTTLQRRFPCARILICPVRVQGDGAANEIAAGVRAVNRASDELGGVDVMIVGRGGGSLEDLWPFNEEVVARAIIESRIPIISAVGHEVNVTIADLVADLRAPTPTAAAELAVPVLSELLAYLDALMARLARCVAHGVQLGRANLKALLRRPAFQEPFSAVFRREQAVDEWTNRLHRVLVQRFHLARRRVEHLEPVLNRIAPHVFLLRESAKLAGFSARLRNGLAERMAGAARRFDRAESAVSWAVRHRITLVLGQIHRQEDWLRGASPMSRVARLRGELDRIERTLPQAVRLRLDLLTEQLRGRQERISALSYRSVLGRGFSITRAKRGGRVVRSLQEIRDGDRLWTELSDGRFESEVVSLRQLGLFE